jgi:CheY-like chemotaxis protein
MWLLQSGPDTKADSPFAPPAAALDPEPKPAPVPRHFIMVEDNVADAHLFDRQMREFDRNVKITVAADGSAAMDLLDQVIEGTVARPDLLILDLNLPVVKGPAILRYIKRSPMLRFLPVIILSSSNAQRDIERAYRDGASSYIYKGRDLDDFLRAVEAIKEYWCGIVDLPGSPDANQ